MLHALVPVVGGMLGTFTCQLRRREAQGGARTLHARASTDLGPRGEVTHAKAPARALPF
jgi:hypothetical protein